jgi:glycosyltransferase involved in cell wall biosynthesis
MSGPERKPQLNVLHVLTLNGRNGEYGGPVRVARELCTELNRRGYATHIFSGAQFNSTPIPITGLPESFVLVKPVIQNFPISSLWSWKLIKPIHKLIKNSDLIHIHFARDLIPFLAALISIILRKPFVTQTHGMITSDGRLSTRFLDIIFTRPLINRSRTNFVLTEIELSAISNLSIKSLSRILPNGIAVKDSVKSITNLRKRVIFCSRLEKRKGIEKFIELANTFRDSAINFEIYGPDGGDLALVLAEIKSRNLSGVLEYKGALQAHQVQEMISEIDLLVLPSKDEPFPMVILEAMAVGTSVLIMPSCGFAEDLANFEPKFVAHTEDFTGLRSTFQKQLDDGFQSKSRNAILSFCNENFGISSVVDRLVGSYKNVS